jgi:Ras-related protein Rab-11A
MTSTEDEDNYDYIYKIVLVGDSGVGKTNLLLRYLKNKFDQNSKATVGVEFGSKNITIDNSIVKAQVWDTAGQERYRSITSAYYKGSHGALVVYDVTKIESFNNIDKWISDLRNNTNEKLVIMLIGNKIDLDKERTVKTEEGQEKSNENEVAYIETSALDSRNVEKAFESIVTKIHKTYINDNIKDMQTQSHQLQKGKNITDNSNTNEHSSVTNKIEHLKCC